MFKINTSTALQLLYPFLLPSQYKQFQGKVKGLKECAFLLGLWRSVDTEGVQHFNLDGGVHKLEIPKCTGFGRDVHIIHLFC